uniref:Putative secreted protein n=1 Tax=Anopheles darlingi TaxID=43151 RepID=A0A2M4DD15_ANODA
MTTSSILLVLLPFLLLSHKQTATTTPSKYEARNRRQSRSARAIGDLATDTPPAVLLELDSIRCGVPMIYAAMLRYDAGLRVQTPLPHVCAPFARGL